MAVKVNSKTLQRLRHYSFGNRSVHIQDAHSNVRIGVGKCALVSLIASGTNLGAMLCATAIPTPATVTARRPPSDSPANVSAVYVTTRLPVAAASVAPRPSPTPVIGGRR